MSLYKDQDFKPMLLSQIKKPFNDPDYIFELKFDGVRALVFVQPNKILIKSRNGFLLNDSYPELVGIKNLVNKKVIFDGEIVSMNLGKPSFTKMQKRIRLKDRDKIKYYAENDPVIFIAFDIIYENKILIDLPLIERKKILSKYKDTHNFVKSFYVNEKGIKLFKKIKNQNLEGIVAKKSDSVYEINKRSKFWIKIKNIQDDDFYICGFKSETNKPMANLLLGKMVGKKLVNAGTVNIGKKNPDFNIIKNYSKIKKPFFIFDGFTYIEPDLVCTIEYTEKTKNGNLRHPVYKYLK